MMKDGISKQNSQLSVLSRAFSPPAIEKSKTTEVLWSTCTSFSWKKLEPGNGLNINDLLRNSLNTCVQFPAPAILMNSILYTVLHGKSMGMSLAEYVEELLPFQ